MIYFIKYCQISPKICQDQAQLDSYKLELKNCLEHNSTLPYPIEYALRVELEFGMEWTKAPWVNEEPNLDRLASSVLAGLKGEI